MPADGTSRSSSSAPLALLWAGVALAPVAALFLVVGGEGGMLRVGALLAMVAVMLVGAGTIMARTSGRGDDTESFVIDEVEALRDDLRGDIAHAAKTMHRSLGERVVALSDTVEALRGQIEVLRAHVERSHLAAPGNAAPPHAVPPVGGASGVVRHTETVQVTTKTTLMDADGRGVYAAPRSPSGPHGSNRDYPPDSRPYKSESAGQPYRPEPARARSEPAPARTGSSGPPSARPASMGPPTGPMWGGLSPSGPSPSGPSPVSAAPSNPASTSAAAAGLAAGQGGPGFGGLPPAGSVRGSVVGERWGSARADGNGSEVSVGERRAEMRSDAMATEMRVEDRWASVVHRASGRSAPARRRHRDEEEDSGYWSRLGSEMTQPTDERTGDLAVADGAWGGAVGVAGSSGAGGLRDSGRYGRTIDADGVRDPDGTGDLLRSDRDSTGDLAEGGRGDGWRGDGWRGAPVAGRSALPAAPSGEPAPPWSSRRARSDQQHGESARAVVDSGQRADGYDRAPAASGYGRVPSRSDHDRVPAAREYGRPAEQVPSAEYGRRAERERPAEYGHAMDRGRPAGRAMPHDYGAPEGRDRPSDYSDRTGASRPGADRVYRSAGQNWR